MNNIELSRQFFDEHVYPVLVNEYTGLLPALSAGLLGEGSEVLGFADVISHDIGVYLYGDMAGRLSGTDLRHKVQLVL